MSDLRAALESVRRQVRPGPDQYEQVIRRFRRAERNRRIGAAAVALTLSGLAIGFVVSGFHPRGEHVSVSPPIDSGNVSTLSPAWRVRLGPIGHSSPLVVGSTAFVTSLDGTLTSIDAASGRRLWFAHPGGAISRGPVAQSDLVLVHTADGRLYAFPARCRTSPCASTWSADTGGSNGALPALSDGLVFVSSEAGWLDAFRTTCGSGGGRCVPIWRGHTGGDRTAPPAVEGGYVWDTSSGTLLVFPEACSGTCMPMHVGIGPGGQFISSGPAASDGLVVVGTQSGRVYAIPTSCAADPTCRPLWWARTGAVITATPVIEDGMVLVGSNDGRLYSFPQACSSPCRPMWVGTTDGPIEGPPAVAGDVVFVTSQAGELAAFPLSCGREGRACAAIWRTDLPADAYAPTVWNGDTVLVATREGDVIAYTVGGTPPRP